ncbi:hypothetical protein GW17_00008219 [Ensete ventricosum]|nr:hypothetical protein GW17_00008219 [Ensete ventricosum]
MRPICTNRSRCTNTRYAGACQCFDEEEKEGEEEGTMEEQRRKRKEEGIRGSGREERRRERKGGEEVATVAMAKRRRQWQYRGQWHLVESRLPGIRCLSTKKSDSGEDKGEVTKKSRLIAWLGLILRMVQAQVICGSGSVLVLVSGMG